MHTRRWKMSLFKLIAYFCIQACCGAFIFFLLKTSPVAFNWGLALSFGWFIVATIIGIFYCKSLLQEYEEASTIERDPVLHEKQLRLEAIERHPSNKPNPSETAEYLELLKALYRIG